MMNYFEKIKSKLPQPFWSSSPPQPSECLDDVNVRRLTHLWDQIVELENRVSVQQKEITLTDDGVSSLNEIKRRLVRARDIRYKTSLLKLELSRCGSLANETNANWEKYEERKKKRHWSKQKRVAAIRNIEDIKRPESLLICLKCLADSHGDVRQEAVVKLRYEGAVDVSLIVAIMLKDESYFVRLEAAKTLGVLRSKATVYNLFKALGDEHGLVRKAAKESLSTMLPMVSEINIDSERENLRIEIAKWINWWVDARIDFPHIDKTALPGSEFKTPMAPVFSGNKIQNVGNRANPERLGEQPKTTRGAEGVFQ